MSRVTIDSDDLLTLTIAQRFQGSLFGVVVIALSFCPRLGV